jgi:Kef-type K+ transport system membrane component KefB/nucleotide-binding universal stress UspA family protein
MMVAVSRNRDLIEVKSPVLFARGRVSCTFGGIIKMGYSSRLRGQLRGSALIRIKTHPRRYKHYVIRALGVVRPAAIDPGLRSKHALVMSSSHGNSRRTSQYKDTNTLAANGQRLFAVARLPMLRPAFLLIPTFALTTAAFAAEQRGAEPSEALFIAEIVLLLLVGRVFGEIMQRIGQPAVMGQLIAGILLGPSVLGAIWPEMQHAIFADGPEQRAMLDAVSALGILMLLLLTGMETDLKLVQRARRAAVSVSAAGIVVPFVLGFALGEFLPEGILPRPDQRLITSLFLGTALSVASVKIVAMVVREMNFMRRKIGMTLVASAIIDDTVGWTIIAITSSLALHGVVNAASLVQSVIGTAVFLLASFTLGRRLVFALIRWTNDMFISEVPVVTAILIVMGAMALTTHMIGIHTVLGAFIAGILVGESPILSRHIDEQLRGLVVALFMPIFFALAGLHADLSVLANFLLALALIAIASLGKFGGAFVGGALARLSGRESLALACGMNARGSTEVIVASIGLSMGVISQDLFTMIVTMAIVTTLAMPPMLRWALARVPLQTEEQARLAREAFERTGFITNVERLLVVVDDSANGRLALRLAGLIAGSRGITTTVLHLGSESAESEIRTAIAATASSMSRREGARRVHLTLRTHAVSAESAVTKEAQKGYGLLILGIAKTVTRHGGFHEQISRIVALYEGPLAVVLARGAHTQHPDEGNLNILVPVRGNKVSRRAAEVALALTRPGDRPLTAFYVLSTVGLGSAQRRLKRATPTHRHEESVLKDIVELADRFGQSIRTALRLNIAPENAILRQARLGHYNLIVMGVGRPAGETLFFGKVAAAVLEHSDRSIFLVST